MLNFPFYLTGIGMWTNQHPRYRSNGLFDYQFLYTVSGNGYLMVEEEFHLTANTGVFFEPGIDPESEPWTTWWITFNGCGTSALSAFKSLGHYSVLNINEADKINLLYHDIFSSAECTMLLGFSDLSCKLYKLLLEINNCSITEHDFSLRTKDKQLQNILSYLEKNYCNDITLEDMALFAGVTPQHFCRIFKQAFNMRPSEYLTQCRLQKAKSLLSTSEKITLKEIAALTGFHDVSYFCSVFKQNEGITPSEYKKIH